MNMKLEIDLYERVMKWFEVRHI